MLLWIIIKFKYVFDIFNNMKVYLLFSVLMVSKIVYHG